METMVSQQKAKAWTGILYLEHLIATACLRNPADMLVKLETLQGFVSPSILLRSRTCSMSL